MSKSGDMFGGTSPSWGTAKFNMIFEKGEFYDFKSEIRGISTCSDNLGGTSPPGGLQNSI